MTQHLVPNELADAIRRSTAFVDRDHKHPKRVHYYIELDAGQFTVIQGIDGKNYMIDAICPDCDDRVFEDHHPDTARSPL
jgi:hypothetical protein